MNAAQMLAAAGEPNTTAGRAKFHQRFTSKAAFDAWYNSKKEYGGGLTDGIAFPQQPDASSNKAPYYEKGGFFAPNVMPWNGPIGFYEHGGMTDEIAFPQQPTERINFSAFPWQPKYDMGGLPGGSNDMPCLECGGNMAYGGYMQPGGYVQAPDADAYFAAQDAAANYPAQGTNINYDYSKVTNPNTALLNNYTADELNMMGANLPVANPVQDARFKKINDYNKEHPIIPAGGGLFKYSSPKSGQEGERLQYANGKYQLYTPPPNQPLVHNAYGGGLKKYQGDKQGSQVNPWQTPGSTHPDDPNFIHSTTPGSTRWVTKEGKTPFQELLSKPKMYGSGKWTGQDTLIHNDPRLFDIEKAISEKPEYKSGYWGAPILRDLDEGDRAKAYEMTYGAPNSLINRTGTAKGTTPDPYDQMYYDAIKGNDSGTAKPVSKELEQKLRYYSKAKKYGGYMQTGGTTEMDQGQYTNGMAQDYMKSLADFNMSAQPMPMGNVQEAGYANYGTEVNNNFNTLDMNAVDQMSSMQDRIDALKNKQTSIFDLGRNMTNIGSSIYQKPMSYKTKTVGSGMMGPAASPVGTSNNWADTRSNMAAKQAAGNMFKEYGGDFFQNGGSENKMNYQNRVQDILMKGQARPTFGQSSAQSYKGNAAQAAANTQGVQNMTQLPQSSQGKYTPEQIAAFQQMMQSFYNQNAYAPSYQAYDPKGQFPMSQFLNNSALKDIAWKGYGRKGKATFRTVYDPSTGKTVQIPTDQSKQARNYDSTKTGQEAKGPGFIKNLIAKNKQRKAGKQATKDNTQPPTTNQQAFTSGYPSVHIAPTNPNSIFPQKYPASPYDANMPQHFLPTSNMNPAGFPVWNNVNLEPAKGYGPGLAFGGTPYEEGAELEMDEEAIANYLAMGGTLEYLD